MATEIIQTRHGILNQTNKTTHRYKNTREENNLECLVANSRFIHWIINQQINLHGLPISLRSDLKRELYSYGVTGLLEAFKRYKPELGHRFSTFAYYRVKGAITQGIKHTLNSSGIKFGNGLLDKENGLYNSDNHDINQQKTLAYYETHGDFDSLNSISRRHKGRDWIQSWRNFVESSLDDFPFFKTNFSIETEDFKIQEYRRVLRGPVRCLPKEDQLLIYLHFIKDIPLTQIANTLGFSVSWASRRLTDSLKVLRERLALEHNIYKLSDIVL